MSYLLHAYIILQDEGPDFGSGSGSGDDEGVCPDGSVLCSNSTKCILESSLCDRINDCGNWEDELASECGGK